MSATHSTSRIKLFWRHRVVDLIKGQLRQGITPRKIALTISLSITLGIFPILGATTVLCLIAGYSLKLNQPIMQLINWLISGLQLLMILVFVRIGEWITHSVRVNFSVPEMLKKFQASPKEFFQEFGMTGVHGIVGWLLVSPFLAAALYYSVLPPLKKVSLLNQTTPSHVG